MHVANDRHPNSVGREEDKKPSHLRTAGGNLCVLRESREDDDESQGLGLEIGEGFIEFEKPSLKSENSTHLSGTKLVRNNSDEPWGVAGYL